MKIIIIGAGAAGSIAAINYKRNHPKDDVLIIEHLDKPLKKILATGNGKCNLGNERLIIERYSNSNFVSKVLKDYSFDEYKRYFKSLNIQTKLTGELLYPVSESAISVREALISEFEKLGIKVNTDEEFVDYSVKNQITVKTNKANYICDKLFITGAGKSSPKLGSDGSVFEILKKHGYSFIDLKPGLCPIYTKEKTRVLEGTRVKANVTLYKDRRPVHKESGEVLFKSQGLSGIAIFNISSIIARDTKSAYEIRLDLLEKYKEFELENDRKNQTNADFLRGYLHPTLIKYFNENNYQRNPIKYVKGLPFTFKDFYGFEVSQVSVGGLKVENFNPSLESKLEKNVYCLGELLDVDGPCGGYNLTWAFYSAIHATK